MKAEIEGFDPRAGGAFRITLHYIDAHPVAGKTTNESDVVSGRFVELIPNQRVVWATTFDSSDPAFAGEMIVAFSLADDECGTQVTCTCENIPSGVSLADNETGTRESLAKLAALLER
jgi:uncharacterized protein YndB with AHSA1/START domain